MPPLDNLKQLQQLRELAQQASESAEAAQTAAKLSEEAMIESRVRLEIAVKRAARLAKAISELDDEIAEEATPPDDTKEEQTE